MAAAREASGYMALERESEEAGNQQEALFDQLSHTKPTTMAGAISMLEIAAAAASEEEFDMLAPALAGLREIAVRFVPELAPLAAHAAVNDHRVNPTDASLTASDSTSTR
jgi:hypothetical protein